MVTMDTLIEKAGKIAVQAERVGLDDVATELRANARLFRELKDDFRKHGEEV